MSGFLLDTNCISELVAPSPAQPVIKWMDAVDEDLLYLSVLTIGEIRQGVASLSQSKRRTRLESWLEADLRVRFAGRILPIDAAIADRWGALAATAGKGKTLSIIDGLLASTAIHHNLTVVTRNAADFADAQVLVLNPWDA